MEVSQNGWFIMENTIQTSMVTGGTFPRLPKSNPKQTPAKFLGHLLQQTQTVFVHVRSPPVKPEISDAAHVDVTVQD